MSNLSINHSRENIQKGGEVYSLLQIQIKKRDRPIHGEGEILRNIVVIAFVDVKLVGLMEGVQMNGQVF